MARRGDEKTIKVSADVADLQRAFENVERAYADVSKASGDYARAVEASAKAVTDDEKAIAKEVEKTTKAILQATKQRAAAYKSQASAIKTQVDAVKQKVTATDADTVAQGKNTKAAGAAKVAVLALGMAVLGAATKFADLTRKVAESTTASAAQQEAAKRSAKSMDDISEATASATLEFTNFIASALGLDGAEGALRNLSKSVKEIELGFRTLATMAKNDVGIDEAIKLMQAEDKRAKKMQETQEFTQRMSSKYQADLKEAAEEEDRINSEMDANQAERIKSMEAGDKKRADAASKRAEAARKAREEDEKLSAQAETELAFAEAENERLNAEQALLDLREQTNQMIDETHIRLQEEMEIRHLEQTMREGESEQLKQQHELEKALFDIRTSGASEEEQVRAKRIAMLGVETAALSKAAATAKKKSETDDAASKATYKAAVDATAGVGKAALEAAGLSNAATAAEAGVKTAFYTGESIAAFAAGNVPSGIGFAAAAAQQAIVAGGSLAAGIGGMSGGGGSKGGGGGGAEGRLTSGLPATATTGPRETGMTVNVNTLSYVSPEDARRIGQAEAREATSTVGGRK